MTGLIPKAKRIWRSAGDSRVSFDPRRNRLSRTSSWTRRFNRIGRTLGEGRRDRGHAARPLLLWSRGLSCCSRMSGASGPVRFDEAGSADTPSTRAATLYELDEDLAAREPRLECLDRCLAGLNAEQRDLS